MVSKTEDGNEFGLMNTGYSANELILAIGNGTDFDAIDRAIKNVSNKAMKNYYLSTTIKCNMDFQKFPFDDHTCDLEVS